MGMGQTSIEVTAAVSQPWNPQLIPEAFKYLTPKLRLEEYSLNDNQILAASFHMVCSPTRCVTLVESIKARRSKLRPGFPPPIFVWEPVPDLCTPEELSNLQEAVKHVQVVSPNGDELAQFFSEASGNTSRLYMVEQILSKAESENGAVSVVVRDGADGSRLYLEGRHIHFRAYHQHGVGVVDPTGGGNAYLGAISVGVVRAVEPGLKLLDDKFFAFSTIKTVRSPRWKTHVLATIHATIAASYAIEQVGTPSLSSEIADCWNGQAYGDRFEEYIDRERAYILEQMDGEEAR
jgi:sugar/nucleoside kinase (ribokinase family)